MIFFTLLEAVKMGYNLANHCSMAGGIKMCKFNQLLNTTIPRIFYYGLKSLNLKTPLLSQTLFSLLSRLMGGKEPRRPREGTDSYSHLRSILQPATVSCPRTWSHGEDRLESCTLLYIDLSKYKQGLFSEVTLSKPQPFQLQVHHL